jgi:hypothetical protein
MRTAKIISLVIGLTAIFLVGRPDHTQAQRALMYTSRQCNEHALELHLDPRRFQKIVGPEFSLTLVDGKARVVIVAHDCRNSGSTAKTLGQRRKSASGSPSVASKMYDRWSERSRPCQPGHGSPYLKDPATRMFVM